jgi:hypothetical protein
MCAPMAFMIAAAVASAASSYKNAQAEKQAAKYQAQVAGNNAKAAEQQAVDALQRGDMASQQVRRKYDQLGGTQRAAMAARGLDIGEGSALSILEDTAYFGELDQRTVRANAAREAWGYRVQGSNFQANSMFLQSQSDNTNPLMSAGLSLLGSSGQVAGKWYGSKGPG